MANLEDRLSQRRLFETIGKKSVLQPRTGGISSERTISFHSDGKEILIPTIIDGRQHTAQEAIKLFRQGRNKPIGIFDSVEEANIGAEKRVRELDIASGGTGKFNTSTQEDINRTIREQRGSNMPEATVQDQLKNLSDDQLQQILEHAEQIKTDSTAQNVSGSILSGAEGALLASQGRPVSEASVFSQQTTTKAKEPEDLGVFEKKERIKAEIKREFKEDKDPSEKEKIETKLLGAVASQLGITAEDVDVTDEGEVAVKTGIDLPAGTTITVGGISLPVIPKKTASQEKRDVEKTQLSDELSGLFESFTAARTEGEKTFGGAFGARGPIGRITGKVAGVKGKLGLSPAIDVFNSKRKAFATVVAKAAGEVRPTDVDIQRFVETLMSTERTDEENELIMKDLLRKVESDNTEELKQLWENATGRSIGGDKKPDIPKIGGTFQGQKIINIERID